MRALVLSALLVASLGPSCLLVAGNRGMHDGDDGESAGAEKASGRAGASRGEADGDADAATLAARVEIQRRKIEQAELELAAEKAKREAAVAQAEGELALVATRIERLEGSDHPNRVEEARQKLQGERDDLQEAKEELQQLEMMYGENDLADKTKEIVLQRGRRRVQRAEAAVALEEKKLAALADQELPEDLRREAIELAEKGAALDQARRGARTGVLEKEIAVREAEVELEKLEAEKAKAEKE